MWDNHPLGDLTRFEMATVLRPQSRISGRAKILERASTSFSLKLNFNSGNTTWP
jgi:hypothetical protein